MDEEMGSESIIKFCEPTTSQEVKFSNFQLAREYKNVMDSGQAQFSSSLDPTPSQPSRIIVISLHGSPGSVRQCTVENVVFLTPPEHHFHSHLSSLDDQNPNERCAKGTTNTKVGEVSYRTVKVRASETGLYDEPESKRVRVDTEEEFDGETVPLGEIKVFEIEGDTDVQDLDVVFDNGDSGGEQVDALCLGEVQELTSKYVIIGGLMKNGVGRFDAINRNHELRKKRDCVGIKITRRNKPSETIKLKHIVGEKYSEVKLKSDASGSEKVDEIMKDAEIPKDIHNDESVRSNGKGIKEIEEFGYAGDVNGRCERRTNRTAGVSGRRRQLPPSLKGKEKEVVGNLEKKSGFLELLDEVQSVLGDLESECEEVDILETAKQCGWTFPRVRWWPPDGEDWNHGLP